MGKTVKELVTHWGPSSTDWSDEPRTVVDRDETGYRRAAEDAQPLEKVSINEIFPPDVVTGIDLQNGYLPLVLYANDDLIIEVANCDRDQGAWHRNLGADEWAFQYRGSRTLETERGPVTLAEGEMVVVPRGVAHKNVGHGPNLEIVIYTRKPLQRLVPEAHDERLRMMRLSDAKPVLPVPKPK
jgi:mannose-6-phosphate isomerase-like protein (cupin superfamily)